MSDRARLLWEGGSGQSAVWSLHDFAPVNKSVLKDKPRIRCWYQEDRLYLELELFGRRAQKARKIAREEINDLILTQLFYRAYDQIQKRAKLATH